MENNDHIYQSLEFQQFFRTARRSMVLKANPPVFTILAVSDLYLNLIHRRRDEINGKGFFEVFPFNSFDPNEKSNVFNSLNHIIATKKQDYLPVIKGITSTDDSSNLESPNWTLSNEPIMDSEGVTAYIINTTIVSEEEDSDKVHSSSEDNSIRLVEEYYEQLERELNERTLELKTSRDQVQSILDTTLLQISVLEAMRDIDGHIVNFKIKWVNKELERVTGRDDLAGKLYLSEFPGIKKVGIFDLIVKTIQTGIPQQMEYYYAYEGFMTWFQCMFVKSDDGVVATNIDITSRKQAEDDRFKNYVLLQQSEDMTFLGNWGFDLLRRSLTWSDGMYRLFELEKGVEIRPEIYLKYATGNGRTVAEKIVQYILDGEVDFEEILEINISGRVKVLHLKAAVVRNEVGKVERVLGVDMDMTAIYAAEEKIRKKEIEQQLEIFRVSLSTLEEERHRISERLHNGIAQILYGIKLNIGSLNQELQAADFKNNKAYVSKLLTDAINETRRISHELMPSTLEQFGLKSAILDICSQLSENTRFKCTILGLSSGMEKYLELAIYRTTQELMTNVVKHANATKCMVIIHIEQQSIRIQVNDNGKGMENEDGRQQGIGLASIRSKIKLLNGSVEIDSLKGRGTNIEVVIPRSQSGTDNV